MSKYLIILLAIIFPSASLGCTVPKSGAEFDALIDIKKIAKNTFKATISKKAGDLNFGASIKVNYYPEGSKQKLGEYWKGVYEKEVGLNYVVSFDLKKIEGYVPFVEVFWYPKMGGLCGAYGMSNDLLLE